MYVFKLPASNKKNESRKLTVIGVIDASGSMKEHWPLVAQFWNQLSKGDQCFTFTFDTKTREVPSNTLDKNLMMHGGGGTKLPEVFLAMEEKLKQVPLSNSITVIFISDGQDNYEKTLESRMAKLTGNKTHSINFICLGIKSEFPTLFAMRLRSLYHTGDPGIPALFLIEYPSEKAFFNKFNTMRNYFLSKTMVKVSPLVRSFPWSEYVDTFFEETWVICEKEEITVDAKPHKISMDGLTVENILDFLRGWIQELHFISLHDKTMSIDCALVGLKYANIIIDDFRKRTNIDIRGNMEIETTFFSDKALKNYMRTHSLRVKWFLKEMELISNGHPPSSEDEYTAAKRIALGTLTGRDNQKVLALKNLTLDVFDSIKKEFKEEYLKVKLGAKESTQERSFISLQNQKEVFAEEKFLEGLDYCTNQFQLFEALPIIGYAIKIKRYEGSNINPWLIDVRFIAIQHKVIESTFLVSKDMKLELKNISGRNEEINSLLPLFDQSDEELFPLLRTRLFRLVMTYMVTTNHDIYHNTAYLSLLAHSLIFFVQKFGATEWTYCTYASDKGIKEFHDLLINRPSKALPFFENTFKRLIELPELLIHIFMISRNLGQKQTQPLLEFFFIEYIYRMFVANEKNLARFIKTENHQKAISELMPLVMNSLYPSKVPVNLDGFLGESFAVNSDICVVNTTLLYSNDNRLNLKDLEKVSQFVCEWSPSEKDYKFYINHVSRHCEKLDRYEEVICRDDAKVSQAILATLLQTGKISQLVEKKMVLKDLQEYYKQKFAKTHFGIVPLSQDQLKAECVRLGLNYALLKLNSESGLLENACLAPECPHYLKPIGKEDLKKHLSSWCGRLPFGFHKLVKSNIHLSSEEIFNVFKNLNFDPKKYKYDKDFVIDYINKIKGESK